jgi:very-short-patch-repair endonuclease
VAAKQRARDVVSLPESGDSPIAALADGQYGIVTYLQLTGLGYTREAIQHRVEAGRLHVRYKGVYAVGYRELTPKGHALAAVLAYGPTAVLSHQSAAELWQLRPHAGRRAHVTVPGTSRKSRPRIQVHRARRLEPEDITVHQAIPLTSVGRTLVDLAAVVSSSVLTKAIEEAERRERFDLIAIEATIARAPTRKGVKPLLKALSAYRPPPTTRSRTERRMIKALHSAGLREPRINTLVADYEADLYWPEARLVVEIDSPGFHDNPRVFETDRIKDAVLQRHGIAVLRITEYRVWNDLASAVNDVLGLYAMRVRPAA